MIIANECRRIGWDEAALALRKTYESGFRFTSQVRATTEPGWRVTSESLVRFLKDIPVDHRLTTAYFFTRGMHDGLRGKEAESVEPIIAAYFSIDEEEKRIVPVEVGEFIAKHFPGK